MTDPKAENLTGITFEGQPITATIKATIDRDHQREIRDVLKEQQREQSQLRPPSIRIIDLLDPTKIRSANYVPHSRAKLLPSNQIREEYGVMAKPHRTNQENIIDSIRLSDRPISNAEIAASTGLTIQQVGSITSGFFGRMKNGDGVVLDKSAGFSLFWIDKSRWPVLAELIETFRRQKGHPGVQPIDTAPPPLPSSVGATLGAALSQVLGVEVRVSGQVTIEIKLVNQC
jgi:hypothetical protein